MRDHDTKVSENVHPDGQFLWSVPMALAWAAFQDEDAVRDHAEVGTAEAEIVAADLLDDKLPIASAKKALLGKLEAGKLVCVGRRADGDSRKVPAAEWPELDLAFIDQLDVSGWCAIRADGSIAWHALRFNGEAVIATFPEEGAEQPSEPATPPKPDIDAVPLLPTADHPVQKAEPSVQEWLRANAAIWGDEPPSVKTAWQKFKEETGSTVSRRKFAREFRKVFGKFPPGRRSKL